MLGLFFFIILAAVFGFPGYILYQAEGLEATLWYAGIIFVLFFIARGINRAFSDPEPTKKKPHDPSLNAFQQDLSQK